MQPGVNLEVQQFELNAKSVEDMAKSINGAISDYIFTRIKPNIRALPIRLVGVDMMS